MGNNRKVDTKRQTKAEVADQAKQLLRRSLNSQLPFQALPAISALRQCLDHLEREAIETARQKGAAWEDVAEVMGITRQALYYRMRQE